MWKVMVSQFLILWTLSQDINDGVNYNTFRNGVNDIFVLSDDLAKKIFYSIDVDYSGILSLFFNVQRLS